MAIRDWLVFTRTHTAALTIPGVLIGAYLGDPATSPAALLGFGVLAWLAHASGFGINNLLDLTHDRLDPHKKHHPLVAGRIRERDAWLATLLGAYAAYTLAWALAVPGPAPWFVLGFAGFGALYNHQSKTSYLAPLWISTSFACLPLYAYSATNGSLDPVAYYVAAYSWILMMGQIAVSGYLKELGQLSEINALRFLGASARDDCDGVYEYAFPGRVVGFAHVVRVPLFMGAGYAALAWGVPLVLAPLALGVWAWRELLEPGKTKRTRKVLWMGLAEIAMYWSLVVSLAPWLSLPWIVGLVVGPLAWYVALNRVFWGSWLAPRV